MWKTIALLKKQIALLLKYAIANLMRSLAELKKDAANILLQIRRLLLSKNSFEEGITDKLTTIATITTLRDELVKIQREIRIRFPDELQ